MSVILGISAYYHDSAAALVVDGKVVTAAQEERFNREKHSPVFPLEAIRYCLEEAGIGISDLDAVVFYDKPLLKFERLLETYFAFAPRGLFSFLRAIPVWIKQKLFLRKRIYDGLKEIESFKTGELPILFSDHHLSHAASAFYGSGYPESAILTIDGVGEWSTASMAMGGQDGITTLREMHFPHSVGLLYSAFTYFLGFKVNEGEYKVMGLAPYGHEGPRTQEFVETIKSKLVTIFDDGSILLNMAYFDYPTGSRMVKDDVWAGLFGTGRRTPDAGLEQVHCDLAMAIQKVTEEIVLAMAKTVRDLTGSSHLCLAGGVALNVVANSAIRRAKLFENIYVQPAAGDAGGALGAAWAVSAVLYDEKPGGLSTAYLGPSFSRSEILRLNSRLDLDIREYSDESELLDLVAEEIADGKVVGWFQGRMEFGPRALGNRSILADPRNPEMQSRINHKIKFREGFRPFAPAVLEEDAGLYFDNIQPSPYMLFTFPVKDGGALDSEGTIQQRLSSITGPVPAITHVDGTARVQTVSKTENPRFYSLLTHVKAKTGMGMVVNTSFNVKDEPIVCSPYDAVRCFLLTDMDVLVIHNFVYRKPQ